MWQWSFFEENNKEDEKLVNKILSKYPQIAPYFAFINGFREAISNRDKEELRNLILYEKKREDPITKGFKVKSEARQWVRKMESLKDKNIKLYKWSMSFAEYYEEYVYNVKKQSVRESTFENYKQSIKFIKKYASNIKIKYLCYDNIQYLIDQYVSVNTSSINCSGFINNITFRNGLKDELFLNIF